MSQIYEFRYFIAGPQPVFESMVLHSTEAARVRGASEFLQMPGRRRVEVWRGADLVYSRQR